MVGVGAAGEFSGYGYYLFGAKETNPIRISVLNFLGFSECFYSKCFLPPHIIKKSRKPKHLKQNTVKKKCFPV